MALADARAPISTVIAGLGGRPITKTSLQKLLERDELEGVTFLDLNKHTIECYLERENQRLHASLVDAVPREEATSCQRSL